LARHSHLRGTRGSNTHLGHGGFGHGLPHSTNSTHDQSFLRDPTILEGSTQRTGMSELCIADRTSEIFKFTTPTVLDVGIVDRPTRLARERRTFSGSRAELLSRARRLDPRADLTRPGSRSSGQREFRAGYEHQRRASPGREPVAAVAGDETRKEMPLLALSRCSQLALKLFSVPGTFPPFAADSEITMRMAIVPLRKDTPQVS